MPSVKAIIMYTKIAGGFGDLLFASQLVSQLKERFAMDDFASKIDKPIFYIVTDYPKAKIVKLGLVAEFGVEVLTEDGFQALVKSKKIEISLFIEGPAIFWNLHKLLRGLDISADLIPVISICEYGLMPEFKSKLFSESSMQYRKGYGSKTELQVINNPAGGLNRHLDNVSVICTGFDKANGEQGVLFDKKLINGDRDKFVTMLDNEVRKPLLRERSIDHYLENTDLSFIYCSRGESAFYPFLRLCFEFVKYKRKNEDIVMVGSTPEEARNAFKKMESKFSANGFKILFCDRETEAIINSGNGNTNKTLRVFYYRLMTHQSMLGCIGLSGELISVTGDQSLSEAISARKSIILYECLIHKKVMIGNFHEALIKAIKNEKLKLLIKPYLKLLSSGDLTEETYKQLGLLFRNPDFRSVLKQATLAVLKENDLIDVVADIILKKSHPDQAVMVEVERFLLGDSLSSGTVQEDSSDFKENNMEQSEASLLELLERLNSGEIDLLLLEQFTDPAEKKQAQDKLAIFQAAYDEDFDSTFCFPSNSHLKNEKDWTGISWKKVLDHGVNHRTLFGFQTTFGLKNRTRNVLEQKNILKEDGDLTDEAKKNEMINAAYEAMKLS